VASTERRLRDNESYAVPYRGSSWLDLLGQPAKNVRQGLVWIIAGSITMPAPGKETASERASHLQLQGQK
jgi:hypothetical protein